MNPYTNEHLADRSYDTRDPSVDATGDVTSGYCNSETPAPRLRSEVTCVAWAASSEFPAHEQYRMPRTAVSNTQPTMPTPQPESYSHRYQLIDTQTSQDSVGRGEGSNTTFVLDYAAPAPLPWHALHVQSTHEAVLPADIALHQWSTSQPRAYATAFTDSLPVQTDVQTLVFPELPVTQSGMTEFALAPQPVHFPARPARSPSTPRKRGKVLPEAHFEADGHGRLVSVDSHTPAKSQLDRTPAGCRAPKRRRTSEASTSLSAGLAAPAIVSVQPVPDPPLFSGSSATENPYPQTGHSTRHAFYSPVNLNPSNTGEPAEVYYAPGMIPP